VRFGNELIDSAWNKKWSVYDEREAESHEQAAWEQKAIKALRKKGVQLPMAAYFDRKTEDLIAAKVVALRKAFKESRRFKKMK